jgi:hypothetical protein
VCLERCGVGSEAAKTLEIKLFNVINNEKRKEEHATDLFFSSLLVAVYP